jgi:cellobiose phosphorylase
MQIRNSSGLSIEFLDNGSVMTIDADPVRISLRTASLFSGAAANIWLRKRGRKASFLPLTGPGSNSRFTAGRDYYISSGSWDGLDYECCIRLSDKSLSWEWSIMVTNNTGRRLRLDLIYVQDVGLSGMTSGPVNEYYVSQYIERRILNDRVRGPVICCRQNMTETGGNPWLMIASGNGAESASVDGMQFYGRTFRETGVPEGLLSDKLGGEYAGESSVVALQEIPFELPAGDSHRTSFIAAFLHDHPNATDDGDLERLPGLINELPGELAEKHHGESIASVSNLFNHPALLTVDDLDDLELTSFFGSERRHTEIRNGQLLSFFCGESNHVMLRAKECLSDRPHGHIMQARKSLTPDESIMSTTAFAFGVFNSHITQGNTNFNTLLSVCNSQFNLSPETGQRIFVEIDGELRMLGVPSAFEAGLNHCRWIYKHGDLCLQVYSWTSGRTSQVNMDFRVVRGGKIRILVTHDTDDSNGWEFSPGDNDFEFLAKPETRSMLAARFPEARFRLTVQTRGAGFQACGDEILNSSRQSLGSNLFILDVKNTAAFGLSLTGEITGDASTFLYEDPDLQRTSDCLDALKDWHKLSQGLSLKGDQKDIAAIREILPWYGMNALIHYLTPYGLEQFSGAAWGTRDIAQGPLELLLSMGKYSEAKQVLRIIFSNQHPDGEWPQWWMFDSYRDIRAQSAHGDIIYWCLMALSNYIKASGDFEFLEEQLPFHYLVETPGNGKKSLGEHINLLVNKVIGSFIPGTSLVKYGGGDWNDSLQPVSKDLAGRMISSWTVEMNYQAFSCYAEVCRMRGDLHRANDITRICESIKADFDRYLLRDGIVAGYGYVEEDGSISPLLHPADTRTGIKYSILPMNRGILSRIFTADQAERHQDLIREHLLGPDGARLMDRPLRYSGGIMKLFQRAETSTFFGREIGLMYVHEHIRYAEALARTGRAEEFLRALRQAVPVDYNAIVPCGDIRQSNCYFSSSDVIFRNRYEADRLYSGIMTGKITLRGGWRVYSSGPGIFTGIIISHLLGLRIEWGNAIIDPVLADCLDGLTVSMIFLGQQVTFRYRVINGNFGPKAIVINGTEVALKHEDNQYRHGGAVIPVIKLKARLDRADNMVEVTL